MPLRRQSGSDTPVGDMRRLADSCEFRGLEAEAATLRYAAQEIDWLHAALADVKGLMPVIVANASGAVTRIDQAMEPRRIVSGPSEGTE